MGDGMYEICGFGGGGGRLRGGGLSLACPNCRVEGGKEQGRIWQAALGYSS